MLELILELVVSLVGMFIQLVFTLLIRIPSFVVDLVLKPGNEATGEQLATGDRRDYFLRIDHRPDFALRSILTTFRTAQWQSTQFGYPSDTRSCGYWY